MSLWDDVVADTSPTLHGTHVATLIAARANGWGMVGIWPAARIVSVRANTAGEDLFTVASYVQAIRRCRSVASHHSITAILLALGSDAPLSEEERVALTDEIVTARRDGIAIVAAGGNNDGGTLQTPAQLPGVLSVGGSATDGSKCPISAVGALVHAPGCDLETIEPVSGAPVVGVRGTSEAAAIVVAAVAALRSYRPDLTVDGVEQLLLSTASGGSAGPAIKVAAAFRAAGLSAVVDSAPETPPPSIEKIQPSPPPPSPPRGDGLPDLTATGPERLPRPRARATRVAGEDADGLIVTLLNRPIGAASRIEVRTVRGVSSSRARQLRPGRRIVARRFQTNSVRLRVPRRAALHVKLRYVDPHRARAASPIRTLHVPPARRPRR